jgi:hypothetical protein
MPDDRTKFVLSRLCCWRPGTIRMPRAPTRPHMTTLGDVDADRLAAAERRRLATMQLEEAIDRTKNLIDDVP